MRLRPYTTAERARDEALKLANEVSHILSYAEQYNCTITESFEDWIGEGNTTLEGYNKLLNALPNEVSHARAAKMSTQSIKY